VVGAFISAYRTVYEIVSDYPSLFVVGGGVWAEYPARDLQLFHQGFHDLIAKMVLIWGTPEEIDVPLLKQQVALGQHMKFPQPV
jgi:hypothetical protein